MDTVAVPAADTRPAQQPVDSVRACRKLSTIHEYKQTVKGMVGLMLRLSHEGLSPELKGDMEAAANSLASAASSLPLV